MAIYIDFFSCSILKALVKSYYLHEKKAASHVRLEIFGIRAGFGFSDKEIWLSFLIQLEIPAKFETEI